MRANSFHGSTLCVLMGVALLLAACAPWQPVPVEDRSTPAETRQPVQPPPPSYEVRRGDTLYSIAFRYGLDWRDVARWNDIDEPYTIRPGWELRLSAPPRQTSATTPPTARSQPSEPARQPESRPQPRPVEPEPVPERRAASVPSDSPTRRVAGVDWRWPTDGRVVRAFDPAATRRGIGIGGQAGQAVVAAADGEVVYSGTALIGYGNLVIIKHSATMLSAYGHNQRRLVEEGDRVTAGQTIAEMGRNERDEDILHFEIRRNGQAEDPLQFLPGR